MKTLKILSITGLALVLLLLLSGFVVNYPRMYQQLLDRQLYTAALNKDTKAVERLISEGANINQRDRDNNPLLTEVIATNNTEVALVLLTHKPRVDATNPVANDTALMFASGWGSMPVVRELIRQGADVNAKTLSGKTPLMFAAKGSHAKIILYLLKHGADPNAQDHEGQTVFSIAEKESERAVLRGKKIMCASVMTALKKWKQRSQRS